MKTKTILVRKAWIERHKTKKDQAKIKKIISDVVKKLEKDYRNIYSEHHLQAYIYAFLKDKLPKGWDILVEPTLKNKKKKYEGTAKNISPFFIPDLVIYKKRTLHFEKKPIESKRPIKRIDIDRKGSFVIELALRRSRYGKVVRGIRFSKIKHDHEKYRDENFDSYVIYVNQHPYTRTSTKGINRLNTCIEEGWFKFIGNKPSIRKKQ
jgi:hypothetical protein